MPSLYRRYPTRMTREVAERNNFLFIVESKLKLSADDVEEIANTDEVLKELLETARIVSKRASQRFGGAI